MNKQPITTFGDLVKNRNQTNIHNIVWAGDITLIKTPNAHELNVQVFLLIDIHNNQVIAYAVATKGKIRAQDITRQIQQCISRRIGSEAPEHPVIIHTDRGGQFTSKHYYEWIRSWQNKGFVLGSHSTEGLTGNQVIERFNRTFKTHKINSKTLSETIEDLYFKEEVNESTKIKRIQRSIDQFIEHCNGTPNGKTKPYTPREYRTQSEAINELIPALKDPIMGRSVHVLEEDHNRRLIDLQAKVRKILAQDLNLEHMSVEEIASKHRGLIQAIQYFAQQTEEIKSTLHQIQKGNEELKEGQQEIISYVKPKDKEKRERKLPLRDPITIQLFNKFYAIVGDARTRERERITIQMKTGYVLLFYTGMRINEMREITFDQIKTAIKHRELEITVHKTHRMHRYALTDDAIEYLKSLVTDLHKLTTQMHYNYVFGKDKPAHPLALIRVLNQELKNACEHYNIKRTIKSHSFRVGRITRLLRKTDIVRVAQIIGHTRLDTTQVYNRNYLTVEQSRSIVEAIDRDDSEDADYSS